MRILLLTCRCLSDLFSQSKKEARDSKGTGGEQEARKAGVNHSERIMKQHPPSSSRPQRPIWRHLFNYFIHPGPPHGGPAFPDDQRPKGVAVALPPHGAPETAPRPRHQRQCVPRRYGAMRQYPCSPWWPRGPRHGNRTRGPTPKTLATMGGPTPALGVGASAFGA